MATDVPTELWRELRLLVRGADGDCAALSEIAESGELVERAVGLRLGPALALAAESCDLRATLPARWRSELRGVAVLWLRLGEAAASALSTLVDAGLDVAPLKGFDVGTRFYSVPEQRPTSDLDLLVRRKDLDRARASLLSAGWKAHETTDRQLRFLEQEGYTSHFSGRGVSLELHFRLWGLTPEGMGAEMLQEARPNDDGPGGGLRLLPAHAYLIAAVHGWNRTSPRDLGDWRDLQAILTHSMVDDREAFAAMVVEGARRWSLQLPVSLSAEVAAALWPDAGHQAISGALEPELRLAERRVLADLRTATLDDVPLSRVVLARLLAGRESRAGWRSVWRRIWSHPGVVEANTSPEWSWARRRATDVWRSLFRA